MSDTTSPSGTSRRNFIKTGVALGASVGVGSALLPSAADAADPKVLNYLSWPGNADPAIVGEFEKEHGVKI
ncbi:MAG TPA: twin-arginine translocation signal domain-containing protein, partial [Rhizobacter sp.]|nr:twin-arginine translocation signal domain-containing protein [Rhizobacter sp.]